MLKGVLVAFRRPGAVHPVDAIAPHGRRLARLQAPLRSGRRRAGSSPQAGIELVEKGRQLGVDDLLGTGDFLKLTVVGWPAHPFWFGDVVANATIRSELAPQLESTAQGSIVRRSALAVVGEPVAREVISRRLQSKPVAQT
jgi:hypothetical protein